MKQCKQSFRVRFYQVRLLHLITLSHVLGGSKRFQKSYGNKDLTIRGRSCSFFVRKQAVFLLFCFFSVLLWLSLGREKFGQSSFRNYELNLFVITLSLRKLEYNQDLVSKIRHEAVMGWIDSSKAYLKAVLLQGGNEKTSDPIALWKSKSHRKQWSHFETILQIIGTSVVTWKL